MLVAWCIVAINLGRIGMDRWPMLVYVLYCSEIYDSGEARILPNDLAILNPTPPIKMSSSQFDRLPPTTSAYVIATAILFGVTGYFIGQGSSLGLFGSKERNSWPNSYNVRVHRDSSDEEYEDDDEESDSEEEGDGGELASLKDNGDEVKLVLVVRTDLGMTKGISPRLLIFS